MVKMVKNSARRRVDPGELGIPTLFEIRTADGWAVRYEGEEAAAHVRALDAACSIASIHGMEFPAALPIVQRVSELACLTCGGDGRLAGSTQSCPDCAVGESICNGQPNCPLGPNHPNANHVEQIDVPIHNYISTACHHNLHDRCRRSCKFCSMPCGCDCGHPAPAEPTRTETCNRHRDCKAADSAYLARHPGQLLPIANFHCHNEDCEDCFGS